MGIIMAESNNDFITEIEINNKKIYVYTPAVNKLTDIINNPTQGGLEIKKNIINDDLSLKFKSGSGDATSYLEKFACQLYTYPFSNWDYKNKKEREKCTRPKKAGSNVVYIDKSNNNNVLKRSTVNSIEKDIIKVNGYDNSIKSHKVIFLDNDYSKFDNKYDTEENYKKFLTNNKTEIDDLLNGYTVSGSIGKIGTSANMNLRNEFIDNLTDESTNADASTTPKKPEASAQIHCNITESKTETETETETDPIVQSAIDAINDLEAEYKNYDNDIENGGDKYRNALEKAKKAINNIKNEDEKKKYQQQLITLTQKGGRRRKRRTKKRSAKSSGRRRRRTMKKRKS